MDLLREHFAHYRPLVAATALGAAAAACDFVTAHLDTRRKAGFITGPRDNALITLGRASTGQSAALSPPGCSDPMREFRCHAWHRTGSRLHARPRHPGR
jgi:hypothetical protein